MKTTVDKALKGKGRVVNNRFTALAAHCLFDPEFCNVAPGWEKGVVEKDVQDNRRRIWQEASGRQFGRGLGGRMAWNTQFPPKWKPVLAVINERRAL